MFAKSQYPIVKNIYHHIQQYNQQHDEKKRIKFVHGSGSSIFAFMGREVTLYENKKATKTTIPQALIPTGILRKKYGLYPVSGELEIGVFSYGSRRHALNYKFLSGVEPTMEGLNEAYLYAKYSNRIISEEKLHENIASIIQHMDKQFFVRSLKMLMMHMTNLMLMSQNKEETTEQAKNYLSLLSKQFDLLQKEEPQNEQMGRYCQKYLSRLENIILNQPPVLTADEDFIKAILQQYPILVCSDITPIDFSDGVPGEQLHQGELSMENIRIIFTDEKHIDAIKNQLSPALLESIRVIAYQEPCRPDAKKQNKLRH